jgi:hypothetical protein
MLKREFAVVPTDKICGGMVISVPPYETFNLILKKVLRQSKIYKNHFENSYPLKLSIFITNVFCMLKREFAVVPTDKICGRSLSSKIHVDMNSFTVTFRAKYLTGMVISVPPYETFNLILKKVLRRSKIYKNHFENNWIMKWENVDSYKYKSCVDSVFYHICIAI